MKRLSRILLVLIGVLVAVGVAARLYLSSDQVREKVVRQLEQSYGGIVNIQRVDIGLRSSSIDGVTILEKDGTTPWLDAERIDTDLTLAGLIRGQTQPGSVRISHAKIMIRLDREGKLVTGLPDDLFSKGAEPASASAIPDIMLQGAEITVRQEGRGDFVVTKIDGSVRKEGQDLKISVKTDDPQWGQWSVGSAVKEGSSEIHADFKSERPVHITQALLEQVPLVPREVLKEVRLQRSDISARGTVTYDLTTKEVHYRADVKPANTDITINAASVTAHGAHGDIQIEDQHVSVRDVEAKVFNGTVKAGGTIDLTAEATQIDVSQLTATGLDVSKFPKSWNFPKQVTAKLNGSASFKAVWSHNKLETEGQGKGEIVDAKLGSQPVAEPIVVELRAVPGGFRFTSPDDKLGGLIAAEEKKRNEPNYLTLHLKMDDVNLGTLEREMNIKLPFALQGEVSFDVTAAIPLDDSGELKKYKLHGSAQLKNFVLGEINVDSLQGEIDFAEGVLSMPKLTGRLPQNAGANKGEGGTFSGNARFPIEPLGNLQATLTFERLGVGQIVRISGVPADIEGVLSGSVTALLAGKTLTDLNTWQAQANLKSPIIAAFGWTLIGITAQVRIENGVAVLSELQTTFEDAKITANGQLTLAAPYVFSATASARDVDLRTLNRLPDAWRPPLSLAGTVSTCAQGMGTLQPLKIELTGHSDALNLEVGGLSIPSVAFDWTLNQDSLLVSHFESTVLGGKLAGSGTIPLRPEIEGSFDLKLDNFESAALSGALPVRVQGRIAGDAHGVITAVKEGQKRDLRLDAEVAAALLRVQEIPVEKLQAKLHFAESVAEYKVAANLLGGTLDVKGGMPVTVGGVGRPAGSAAATGGSMATKGHVAIRGVQIHRLLEALGGPAAQEFHGRFGFELDFVQNEKNAWPIGHGSLRIENLRYQDTPLAPLIVGDVALTKDALELRDISSEFGEGTVRAQARFYPRNVEQSWFSLNFDDVEAQHVLGPWLGDKITGRMQARIRATIGSEISGKADMKMSRGQVLGLTLTDWSLPISFRYTAATARGEVTISETIAQVGQGRLSGRATAAWDYTMRLEGRVELARADLQTLLQGSQLVGGLVTARFDFTGNEMRSLNDLTGNLNASFEQAQAFSTPVLREMSPLLGMGPSTTFQKGTLRAHLEKGSFHILSLALEAVYYQVFAEGRVSLLGALDLDVTANTGNLGVGTPRLRMLGLKIPVTGPVPLSMVQEAASLLGNRVIQVHVGGTIRSPSYRVSTAALFSQEAVRFFLTKQLNPLSSLP